MDDIQDTAPEIIDKIKENTIWTADVLGVELRWVVLVVIGLVVFYLFLPRITAIVRAFRGK